MICSITVLAVLSDDRMARGAGRSPPAKCRTRSRTHGRTVISCSTTKGLAARAVSLMAQTDASAPIHIVKEIVPRRAK